MIGRSISDPQQTDPTSFQDALVDNAGIVLLWPFVERLFENLRLRPDLLGDTPAADALTQTQTRRMLLLHYLATGQDVLPEGPQHLSRLLAGVPATVKLAADVQMKFTEKAICQNLLQAFKARWVVVENHSNDDIRETFLLRSGRLSEDGFGVHLRVATAPFDMLLDQLPWSIGVINHSWMKVPLHVNWRDQDS